MLTLTLLLTDHIEKSAARWLPGMVADGSLPKGVPQGKALRTALDSLRLEPAEVRGARTKADREFNSLVGDLQWMVKVLIRIIRMVHMLSRVGARPPKEAMPTALGVLHVAYAHRHEGLTYGGVFAAPFMTATCPWSPPYSSTRPASPPPFSLIPLNLLLVKTLTATPKRWMLIWTP